MTIVPAPFRRLVPLLLAAIAALAAPSAASAAVGATPPGMPPTGKVLLGVGGTALNPTQFDRLTGARHELHLITITWDEQRDHGWEYALIRRFEEAERGGYRLMIHIAPQKTNGREGRSPGAVARGAADAYFLDLGRQVNLRDEFVYVRPPAEMNGHWSLWSAFNRNGSRRNADHSTANYRRAFIRITEIVRGGTVTEINARLRSNGMPALTTSAATLPSSGKVATVWNPQAEGSPNVAGNMPKDYYPGKRWVDYVANDFYEQNGSAAWKQQEAFYDRYEKAHPFVIAEYAPWGYDGSAFVGRMFAWARSHPRTVALMYFNGSSGTAFRLTAKPRSLATYKARAKAATFACPGFTAVDATC